MLSKNNTGNYCPHCGDAHPPNMAFCPNTGRPLSPSRAGLGLLPWVLGGIILVIVLLFGVFVVRRLLQDVSESLNATQRAPESVSEITLPTPTWTNTPLPIPTETPTSNPEPSNLPSATFAATAVPSETPTTAPPPAQALTPAFSWSTSFIQKAPSVGYYTNLVIDPFGIKHVSYLQETDVIWYGKNEANKWDLNYVVSGENIGIGLDLAVDSLGNPHLAYHFTGKKVFPEIITMAWNGSSWTTERVVDSRAAKSNLSMALDQQDQPNFVYQDESTLYAYYAYKNDDGIWSLEPIAPAHSEARSFPLQIDQFGYPHIAYQGAEGGLYYAVRAGGWQTFLVDDSPGVGKFVDIAIDQNNTPHIAYYDDIKGHLLYATYDKGTWILTTVDSDGDVGKRPSIAVDSQGHIHISYYDGSVGALKYAHGRVEHWDIYIIDNQGDAGQYNSLALDAADIPYISYFEQDGEDIKLATASFVE